MAKNDNVLEGFSCPECDAQGPFRMSVAIWGEVVITDDGFDLADLTVSETEFHELGSCKCLKCGFDGFTPDFQKGAVA